MSDYKHEMELDVLNLCANIFRMHQNQACRFCVLLDAHFQECADLAYNTGYWKGRESGLDDAECCYE